MTLGYDDSTINIVMAITIIIITEMPQTLQDGNPRSTPQQF